MFYTLILSQHIYLSFKNADSMLCIYGYTLHLSCLFISAFIFLSDNFYDESEHLLDLKI